MVGKRFLQHKIADDQGDGLLQHKIPGVRGGDILRKVKSVLATVVTPVVDSETMSSGVDKKVRRGHTV